MKRIIALIVLAICIPGHADGDFALYLPQVTKSEWFEFYTGPYHMRGRVTGWEWRDSLTDYWDSTWHPEGVYAIVLMDVENLEPQPAYIEMFETFWLQSDSTSYPMATFDPQAAAGWEFGCKVVYDRLGRGLIYPVCLVFDVPVRGTYELERREK